ncbi:MAG: hypothetical protein WCO28_03090 [Bacteroidota bacterium]|jgi:hypothetical protein
MKEKECIVCNKSHHEIPLTSFDYKDTQFWICPQHIPILIHNPQKLVDLLPGAEGFEAAPH